ncbi:MAG: hypothetical protein ACR2M9_01045 [Cyanophyceae cyanobacterium]
MVVIDSGSTHGSYISVQVMSFTKVKIEKKKSPTAKISQRKSLVSKTAGNSIQLINSVLKTKPLQTGVFQAGRTQPTSVRLKVKKPAAAQKKTKRRKWLRLH